MADRIDFAQRCGQAIPTERVEDESAAPPGRRGKPKARSVALVALSSSLLALVSS